LDRAGGLAAEAVGGAVGRGDAGEDGAAWTGVGGTPVSAGFNVASVPAGAVDASATGDAVVSSLGGVSER